MTVGLTKGFILTQSLIGQLFPGTPSTSTWTEDTSVYYPAPAPAYATSPAAVLPETQPACYYSTGCSSSCGQGFKVLVPDQAVHACNSLPVQVLPCTDGECPVDCRLTHWTTWSVCSPATVPRELLRILPRERESNSDDTETDISMEEDITIEPELITIEEEKRTKRNTVYGAVVSGSSVAAVVAPICKQNRTRTIERQPTTGGRQCKGEGFDERFCSDTDCQGM